VVKNLNIPFMLKTSTHTIAVRYYHSLYNFEKTPLLLFTHGGGLSLQSPVDYDPVLKRIANETNIHILAIDYRKTPENPFPSGLHDVASLWDWVNTLTTQTSYPQHWEFFRNVDTSNIIVAGDSGGAQLTVGLTFMARDKHVPLYFPVEGYLKKDWKLKISKQVIIYPSFNNYDVPSNNDLQLIILNNKRMSQFFTNANMKLVSQNKTKHNYYENEYLFAFKAKDVESLPPMILVTCKFDSLRDEGGYYGDLLEKHGVKVERVQYDTVHAFLSFPIESIEKEQALQFLIQKLERY
jgi:acetyl esterase/lipase